MEAGLIAPHLHIIGIGSLGHRLQTSQRPLLKAAPSLTNQTAGKTVIIIANNEAA